MRDLKYPATNPTIVLREEFADSALLYDPDSGSTFGLNSLGVFVWKRLDGLHSTEDLLNELKEHCEMTPEDVGAHLRDFIQSLLDQGLADYRR